MKNKSIFIPIFILFTLVLTSCGKATDIKPMSLGDADAPVVIEEFSDVQCPACGQISPQVEDVARSNPDIVRLDFYHFPLPYHEFAFIGAEAAECAEDQGKGWEYLAQEYANQTSLSNDFFMTLAENLKLNTETFKTCMDDHLKKEKIQQHVLFGKERGIPGTPTLFVNGQMIQWPNADQFDAYVKSLAK